MAIFARRYELRVVGVLGLMVLGGFSLFTNVEKVAGIEIYNK